MLLVSDHS